VNKAVDSLGRRFILRNESNVRRSLVVIAIASWIIIFLVQPGGLAEIIVRIIAGVSVLAIYVFWILDEHREAKKHPHSPRIQKLEKWIAAFLWLFIALLVVALALLPKKP
jgi:Ca2+/Na+ antiporter